MIRLIALAIPLICLTATLSAQNGGYWNYSTTNFWKYSPQAGRTDARWAQNILVDSIEFTFENYSAPAGKWFTDTETFKWDMLDPTLQNISILPRNANGTLQPGQKVRFNATLRFNGQYYTTGGAKINIGEPPRETPNGWKSSTDLYPMWGWMTDAVVYLNAVNNGTASDSADAVIPKGPNTGTAQLTITCSTGIQGTAAVEYIYNWVAPVPPTISGVTNATTGKPVITPGAWFTVWGANLAGKSRSWTGTDFSGQQLPTTLDGIQVTVHGRPALVSFISPTQINALAPTDSFTGEADVQVLASNDIKSTTFKVTLAKLAPGFFLYQVAGAKYVIAHAGNEYIGNPALVQGLTTRPVKPGEIITLYGTGFGPTTRTYAPETMVSGSSPLASAVTFTIGGVPAPALWAGQIGSGLYQCNVQVPDVPNGDQEIVATVDGASTLAGVAITVQRN